MCAALYRENRGAKCREMYVLRQLLIVLRSLQRGGTRVASRFLPCLKGYPGVSAKMFPFLAACQIPPCHKRLCALNFTASLALGWPGWERYCRSACVATWVLRKAGTWQHRSTSDEAMSHRDFPSAR